jgi:hypothetical protein
MEHRVNLGRSEGRVRIALGILLLGIAGLTMLPEWGSALAFVVGTLMLFTGIRLFCPLWNLLGIHTCEQHPGTQH